MHCSIRAESADNRRSASLRQSKKGDVRCLTLIHSGHAQQRSLVLQLARWSLSEALRISSRHLQVNPDRAGFLPPPRSGQSYVLYLHVPFCHELCPYCFFTRYPFAEGRARRYYELLRQEMRLAAGLGYDFVSLYIGGGTPTILIDELIATIDLAQELFHPQDVSVETNPNHLTPEVVGRLVGRVNRLSVGVQTFDDGLLRQVKRFEKYGSGEHIFERLVWAAGQFATVNADMIFNLPGQTGAMLRRDVDLIRKTGVNQTTFHPIIDGPHGRCSRRRWARRLPPRSRFLPHRGRRPVGNFNPRLRGPSPERQRRAGRVHCRLPGYVGQGTGLQLPR
jgi:coproporphyrinogen III oxidase-like Fe-S oxidoreductase